MAPSRADRLLISISKALSAFVALSGGMLPVHAVIIYVACLYPNDVDANFCQACGSRTCLKKFVVSTEIAKRFQEFNDVLKAKPYQRQKSALEQELLHFLASLSPPRDPSSCTSCRSRFGSRPPFGQPGV